MKKSFLTIMALGMFLTAFGQERQVEGPVEGDQVLMTINGKPVLASEFVYIYEKNSQETSIDPKSVDEYLELFTNFKLKVAEAESQGIDTTAAFLKELKGYRAQATPKYMQDNDAIDSLLMMSYQRMAHPRYAAHIAVECHQDADSATVADALQRINSARERVTVGALKKVGKGKKAVMVREPEDFAAVAMEVSDDPQAKETRGEVGWIQPFRYVYVFENAVYTTPVGEVTEVFRTPYGFHIAKVMEEGSYEEVHAAHIMKMTPRGNAERAITAKVEIDSLYELVKGGADFAEVASQNSDDRGSAMRGGDLGYFARGMMVQPFDSIAFAMENSTISEPFLTRFGWHIIKQYDKRGILPFDTLRPQLLKQMQRDERMQEVGKSFIAKTRAEYNLPATMSEADVRAYADAHLEEKYPELRHLVQEYHDGILLFDVSLQEVWDKANQDKEGLTQYFKQHRKEYTWDEPRYKGYIIYAKNEVAAKTAKQIIKSADPDSINSYLNHRVNIDSVTYVRVEKGLWTAGKNAAVDKYGFKSKTAEYTPSEEFPIVEAVGKVIKAPQEYADERAKVTTDYQDYLEKQWIAQLREKYAVVINQDVLDQIKSRYAK